MGSLEPQPRSRAQGRNAFARFYHFCGYSWYGGRTGVAGAPVLTVTLVEVRNPRVGEYGQMVTFDGRN